MTPAFEQLVASLSPQQQAAVRAATGDIAMHAEACWSAHDPIPELVVGLIQPPAQRLVELAGDIAPVHAEAIARWLDAMPAATDLGFKIGHRGIQVYARGPFEAAEATRAFEAAGVAAKPEIATNLLAVLDQRELAMVGLELDGERADGALYASVPRVPTTAAALTSAFGFLVRVVAPDQLAAWGDVAPALFDAPADETVYVSMSSSHEWPWAKIDVGMRQLAAAPSIGSRMLAVDVQPMLTAARLLGGDRWSHVGVRFGSGFGPVFYLPIAGDRD